MATHSSVLAWRIPGTGKPGGLASVGSHRVRHDWSDLAAAAAGGDKVHKAKVRIWIWKNVKHSGKNGKAPSTTEREQLLRSWKVGLQDPVTSTANPLHLPWSIESSLLTGQAVKNSWLNDDYRGMICMLVMVVGTNNYSNGLCFLLVSFLFPIFFSKVSAL